MLHLIIADAEIELVPPEIAAHREIRRRGRKMGKSPEEMLLDSSMDHRALRSMPEGVRRGRPDIAHVCLLVALDSIPCREGQLQIYVHTRHDIVLQFDPSTRIPRSQARFYGILEKILREEKGTDLIQFSRKDLKTLQGEISPDLSLGFSDKGESTYLPAELSKTDNTLAVVGGFPRGDFRSPVAAMADRMISSYGEELDAWTVVGEIIWAYKAGMAG
jgi:rRNA small subunit pseudouridine methyltransferase Nep1